MSIRLVLAEDHYLVREGVRRLLETHPDVEVVATCGDLDSLLAAVDAEHPDVVVTDIRMPPNGSDEGIQAASRLRVTNPEIGVVVLSLMGILQNFWVVIGLVVIWSLIFAASMPIRQTYMNGMIPSRQRATILSFDSLMGSSGGVWAQPLLGRVADVWGYGPSYVVGAAISAIAIPCLALSRRQNAPADTVQAVGTPSGADAAESGVI